MEENKNITNDENVAEQTEVKQAKAEIKTTLAPKKEKKTKKAPKEHKFAKKAKDTMNELKRVSWPSFGEVVKKTGVVLAVVAIFLVVVFGFDFVLNLLFKLLTKGNS